MSDDGNGLCLNLSLQNKRWVKCEFLCSNSFKLDGNHAINAGAEFGGISQENYINTTITDALGLYVAKS